MAPPQRPVDLAASISGAGEVVPQRPGWRVEQLFLLVGWLREPGWD